MKDSYGAGVPLRKTIGSCGYDFRAPVDLDLSPGEWTEVDTGIRFDGDEVLLDGDMRKCDQWFMMLVPRSGLGSKYGLRMRNTVGIIDQSYRQHIMATVTVDEKLHLDKGDRFLQGIFMPYLVDVTEDPVTEERRGGMGSTGV